MGLQELNENLHRRDFQDERSTKTVYDPDLAAGTAEVGFESDHWDTSQVRKRETVIGRFIRLSFRFWYVYLAAALVAGFVLIAVNFAWLRSLVFSNDRVTVEISGPTEVASGESVSYRVSFYNMNALEIKNASLSIGFPDAFRIEEAEGLGVSGNVMTADIGTVGKDGSGEFRFSGKFYGTKGSLTYITPTLRYVPADLSAAFEAGGRTGVTIVSSPLFLEAVAPQESMSGNDVEYVVTYRNESDIAYSNVRVFLEYPEGFDFKGAAPRPSEGSAIFRIGELLPHAAGEIRISGALNGESNESKVLAASIGTFQGDGSFLAYERKERLTRMVASPLVIRQTVNGRTDLAVKPGERLAYDLAFSNRGDIGLRDVIVTVELDPSVLDMERLNLSGRGYYDPTRETITWTAADFPELSRLEPGSGGTISFSVAVREDVGVSGEAGKHFSAKTVAKIDSPDVPFVLSSNKIIASNTLEVRVGSVLGFDVLGFHTDSRIPTSGPVPPKVGEETSYELRFRVTNYLNDLSSSRVTITLPPGVRYAGTYDPETEPVSHNARTGEVVWEIGTIPGGGETSRELSILVSVVPGPDRIGDTVMLMKQAEFSAQDVFTDEPVIVGYPSKSSALSEDKGIPKSGYNVIP